MSSIASCLFVTSPHNLTIWKIWAGLSVSQAILWNGMNKSCEFSAAELLQVIVSVPGAADTNLTDVLFKTACHCCQPRARSLWKAHRGRVSIGMETQVYFISLPKCKGESAQETKRKGVRKRGRERPEALRAAVVSCGDGQSKHLRAVWMTF